jgi:hypothetical protein
MTDAQIKQAHKTANYASKYKKTTKHGIRKAGLTTRGPGSGIKGRGW